MTRPRLTGLCPITIESCHCEETRGSTSEAEPSVPNEGIEEGAIESS